jgi:hypothetical protein
MKRFVEEVRTGRRKLAAKTMWKTKAGDAAGPGLVRTSETLLPPEQARHATSQAAPPATCIIGPTKPEIKPARGGCA